IGLLKMDFLGLRTLTVIHRAVEMVSRKLGEPLVASDIPLDDPSTYQLLSRAETVGVFQFESTGMRGLLKQMKPTVFEDIVAATALYRPGPLGAGMHKEFIDRKHGRAKTEVPHPLMEPILEETYGVILYQEQVMAIAGSMAGFSMGEADLLRRAMGKKKQEELDLQRELFLKGCEKNKIDLKVGGEVFDLMAYFAGYGFNKSHSVAYAVLSVQTAWLKANHPAEFLAATLTSESGDSKRVPVLIEEARRMGIRLDPPDINRSESEFTVKDGGIVFGLAAVKNVGVGAIEKILEVRSEGGEFTDLYDFVTRIDVRTVNRRVLESLAQAGAFDQFGKHRAEVYEAVPSLLEVGNRERLDRERGQTSLFAGSTEEEVLNPFRGGLPATEEWTVAHLLQLEKEVLGFYYSGHPLEKWGVEVRSFANARAAELPEHADEQQVILGGLITEVRGAFDKRGNRIAFIEMEDFTGSFSLIAFSDPLKAFVDCLVPDAMVLVGGTLSVKDEAEPKILLNKAIPLDQVGVCLAEAILLDVSDPDIDESFVDRIRTVGERRLGGLKTILRVGLRDGNLVQVVLPEIKLPPTHEALQELEEIVGEGGVRFQGRWTAEVTRQRNGNWAKKEPAGAS
ncbi:MAG: DNA polymerase III subunit alpha, partial [Gemmatimonadetes bacterium]|nr:DNA polymerase III subunit alpha [Gemmatimonadota bacterium]